MTTEETLEYFIDNQINVWGIAMEYAESEYPLIEGKSTTEDIDKMLEIKSAYEAGMIKAAQLLNK